MTTQSSPSPIYVLVGASRGIGAAVAEHLVARGATVLGVSRSPARAGDWIEADVVTTDGLDTVMAAVDGRAIDGLLFLGGVWEKGAFTNDYAFQSSPESEIRAVIATNLVAPILLSQRLVPMLTQAPNPRIVLMGSLVALPNLAEPEVANTAAKSGLQGAAQAMNLSLREKGIGVSVINPGNIATPEVEQDIAEGRFAEQTPIAMEEVIRTIDYLLAVGPSVVPFEISLDQKRPG